MSKTNQNSYSDELRQRVSFFIGMAHKELQELDEAVEWFRKANDFPADLQKENITDEIVAIEAKLCSTPSQSTRASDMDSEADGPNTVDSILSRY